MDPSQSGSTFQTLAAVLAGGLNGYVDSQNQQQFYPSQPLPQTQYGLQGSGQYGSYGPSVAAQGSVSGISPTILILGAVVVAFFLLKK